MLEKTLKFAALPFSVMAFTLTYIYFVETLNYHSLFAVALALIIATATCIVYLFSLLQLPSMIYFLAKDSYKVWKFGKVKFWKKDVCAPLINNITLQGDKSKEMEVNQATLNKEATCNSAKGMPSLNQWQEAKDYLLAYTQNEIFPHFPEKYHSNLLQLVEDFASSNIACTSPVFCSKDEIRGITATDICHFIGNLLLKFKHADKHKVMNRHSACQFAKNAFPNIVTQAHTFVYAKLVQYDEYNKIESFKKEML